MACQALFKGTDTTALADILGHVRGLFLLGRQKEAEQLMGALLSACPDNPKIQASADEVMGKGRAK